MKNKRKFLKDLYRRQVFKIPFLHHFQENKDLRLKLFNSYSIKEPNFLEKNHLKDIGILKSLAIVNNEINDFKDLVLRGKEYNPSEYAINFAKAIIYKLEKIRISKLTRFILNDFVNNVENVNIEVELIFENERAFFEKYGISKKNANSDYRELKRYADNYINDYLTSFKTNKIKESTPITKTISTYHRYSNDYFFDESTMHGKLEKIRVTQAKLVANKLNEYSFKDNKEINKLINQALKRNWKIFNQGKGNYRHERFTFIGSLETFKINEFEYFIEHNKRDNGEITIIICNIDYGKKWLNYLNCLKANYLFEHPKNIKKRILEDAYQKKVANVDNISQAINDLFYHCIDFHNRKYFEKENSKKGSYGLLTKINNASGIWSWKQKKYREYIDSQNSIIMLLQELFIATRPYEFIKIRDFVLFWIEKCINEPIHKGFQWGYSPFKEDIFTINDKILKNHSDKKINLKNSLKNSRTSKRENKESLVKTFSDHFYNLDKKDVFLNNLKEIFKTEKGILFGILIDELKNNDVLKIGNREFKNFHHEASIFFQRDIATREAVSKYKPNEQEDYYKSEIDIIRNKLKSLIIRHKNI